MIIWVLTIFWYSSSIYSCHLFLISSASIGSIPFLPFIVPIFAWNVPLVSLIFLKRSLVFPILLLSCISLHWSLRKAFSSLLVIFGTLHPNGYIFPFLLCLLLLFFSQVFVRPPQTAILPFCISFSWGWSWSLPPVQCHELPSIVLQALSLSDLRELPDVQAGFRRGRGTRDQIASICWVIEKAREFQKNIYFCFIDYTKAFDHVDHHKLWKNSSRDGNTRPPDLPLEKSVCRSGSKG